MPQQTSHQHLWHQVTTTPTQKDHAAQSTETKLQLLMQKDLKAQASETDPCQVTQNTVPVTATTTLADTQTSVLCSSVCLLKTAVAKAVSDVGSAIANILFDEDAQCYFISKKLANALKLMLCQNDAPLPPNFEVCQRRTRSLVHQLASTPNLMKTYDQIIKDLMKTYDQIIKEKER